MEISAKTLLELPTLITSFMCDSSTNMKSYDDLCSSFEKCYRQFSPNNDPSDDLRVLRYEADMREGRWRGLVEITRDTKARIVTDGIHRGIAYLRCLESGLPESKLPKVVLIDKDTL